MADARRRLSRFLFERIHHPLALITSLCAAALLSGIIGCGVEEVVLRPSEVSAGDVADRYELLARFAIISDTQCIDEESPARFAGAVSFIPSAWRRHEAYSTQLFDGIIRAVNRIHASGRGIDFLLHTGDLCDNAQRNELDWAIAIMDGAEVDPRSGPDDRSLDTLPPPELDPHSPFIAQGLYRRGVHGPADSIPWYAVIGNHDALGLGTFPIVETVFGGRYAPLPIAQRPGLVLPVRLDPVGVLAHGHLTPARPGPPAFLELPQFVRPNPARRYFSKREFIDAVSATISGPRGHGFEDGAFAPTWYAVAPVPGIRLIGLDTTDATFVVPGLPYHEGAISWAQLLFLQRELERADERGELVIVASHHPSESLQPAYGSALDGPLFRRLLNAHPSVIVHAVGHTHRHRVYDRGGYLEMETASVLDRPQEGRVIEVRTDSVTSDVLIRYHTFSHLDEALPPLGDDPLRALRIEAFNLSGGSRLARIPDGRSDSASTEPIDRHGVFRMSAAKRRSVR